MKRFLLTLFAVALLAFTFERENLVRLIWLIPQRLIWRWLTWLVLFRAVRRAGKDSGRGDGTGRD